MKATGGFDVNEWVEVNVSKLLAINVTGPVPV
jgi:hypothetical protein